MVQLAATIWCSIADYMYLDILSITAVLNSHLLKANTRQKWTNQATSSFDMPRKSNDFIPEWCVKLEKTWTIIILNFVCNSIVHIWLIIHIRKIIQTWKYQFVSFDPLVSTWIMHKLSYGFTYHFIHWISSHLFIFV